ncbi:TRAP transporter small permease [Oleispirillum naphthae]|uniref:TRAP transporter small permease n=1 Tax=Oleispirillum naphthae TaxID=2838853 RepID=UPI0030825B7F
MEKFDEFLQRALLWTCAVLMFAMMTVIFSQVVARYVLHQSLSWSEEVGRYIFVWITFLGLAAAFKSGSHVALDLLAKALKGVPYRIVALIDALLIVLLAAALSISGIKLLQFGLHQESPALKIPMYYVYLVEPISGLIFLYFAIRALWTCALGNEEG